MPSLDSLTGHAALVRMDRPFWDLTTVKKYCLSMSPPPFEVSAPELWELCLWKQEPRWQVAELMTESELRSIGGKSAMQGIAGGMGGFTEAVAFDLHMLGCQIYRLRLLALAPGACQRFHVDVPAERPVWRFHLPILSHPNAFMDFRTGSGVAASHLVPDGSAYLVNVARPHRVRNVDKRRWRLHLVADFIKWDPSISVHQLVG